MAADGRAAVGEFVTVPIGEVCSACRRKVLCNLRVTSSPMLYCVCCFDPPGGHCHMAVVPPHHICTHEQKQPNITEGASLSPYFQSTTCWHPFFPFLSKHPLS